MDPVCSESYCGNLSLDIYIVIVAYKGLGAHCTTFELKYAKNNHPPDRSLIEKIHNFIRIIALPEAANMLALQYNTSMEPLAETYAKRCMNQTIAGLNTYLAVERSDIDFLSVVSSWQKESPFFQYNPNKCTDNRECSDYMNMIWADTKSFACAVVDCTKHFAYQSKNIYMYACVYYPPADFQAKHSYGIGPSCSKCSPGTICKGKLCYPNHR
nr:hypothetical transcript [Hymenolepis microstoma]